MVAGVRIPGSREADIDAALASGEVIHLADARNHSSDPPAERALDAGTHRFPGTHGPAEALGLPRAGQGRPSTGPPTC